MVSAVLVPVTLVLIADSASGETRGGGSSADVAAVTSVPSSPQSVTGEGWPGSIVARWREPASDGGTLVQQYQARASKSGSAAVTVRSPAWSVSAKITGLSDAQSYQIQVRARNAVGWGPWSAPVTVRAGEHWIVSVGDSYISGEAGRWAGNTNLINADNNDALGGTAYWDTPTGEAISRCHRSGSAEVHLGGNVMSKNLACSGATTATAWDGEYFKPGLDFSDDHNGHQGQALMLQQFAQTHTVRAVAISIGGNDFEFGTIVKWCLAAHTLFVSGGGRFPCSLSPDVLAKITASNVKTMVNRMKLAYRNVSKAMTNAGYDPSSYTIIVQNYPSPIPPILFRYPEQIRQTIGGCGFLSEDALWSDVVLLPTINQAVTSAVRASGLSNVRLLDISDAFVGHRLCEAGVGLLEEMGLSSWRSSGAAQLSEWVNVIRTATTIGTKYFLQESLHPNYWGQLALRRCLRLAYNDGRPRGGRCEPGGIGLTASGEPDGALRGTIEEMSVDPSNRTGGYPGVFGPPAISRDGRYVAFCSEQPTLVGGDTNGVMDVFVRDRQTRTTTRISVSSSGAQGNSYSCEYYGPTMSADGRFIAYESDASNLVPGDYNGGSDIFVYDQRTHSTEWVSRPPAGVEDYGWSWNAAISADGRYVTFKSDAQIDPNAEPQGLFVTDRLTGTSKLVSITQSGQQDFGNNDPQPAISGDGRYILFLSNNPLMTGSDTQEDGVFLRDQKAGTTQRVDLSGGPGSAPIGGWIEEPGISADGRSIVFEQHDTEGQSHIWYRNLNSQTTREVGAENAEQLIYPAISRDGAWVTFSGVQAVPDAASSRVVWLYDVLAGTARDVQFPHAPDNYAGGFESAVADGGAAVAYFLNGSLPVDENSPGIYTWALDCPAGCGDLTDLVAPAVLTTTPLADATAVSRTANVTASFDEPVLGVNSATFTLTNTSSGSKLGATVSYDPVAWRAVLKPAAALPADTTFRAALSSAITDRPGNSLSAITWTFVTGPGPTVTGRSPAPGATGVSRSSPVTASFSESVKGVSGTSFTLKQTASGAAVAATVSYNATTKVATLRPTAPLPAGTRLTVQLTSAIKDIAGNPLTAMSWSFTTS